MGNKKRTTNNNKRKQTPTTSNTHRHNTTNNENKQNTTNKNKRRPNTIQNKMRLLKDIIIKKRLECEEHTINSHYNPKGYYDILTICSIITKQPIQNRQEAQEQYTQLQKYREQNNKTKITETTNKIKEIQHKNQKIYTEFLKTYENIKIKTNEHPEAYTIYSFGVLSFEDQEG